MSLQFASVSAFEVPIEPIRFISGAKIIYETPFVEFTTSSTISDEIKKALERDVLIIMKQAVADGLTKVISVIIPSLALKTGRLRASFLNNIFIRDDELVFDIVGFTQSPLYTQFHIAQLTGQFRYEDPTTPATFPLDLQLLSDLMFKTVTNSFETGMISIGYDFRFAHIGQFDTSVILQSLLGAMFK